MNIVERSTDIYNKNRDLHQKSPSKMNYIGFIVSEDVLLPQYKYVFCISEIYVTNQKEKSAIKFS